MRAPGVGNSERMPEMWNTTANRKKTVIIIIIIIDHHRSWVLH